MTARNTDGERGVTPVVGIVLLIAITILLASTVAAFALGFEDETGSPEIPTTVFDIDYDHNSADDDQLTAAHKSGSSIEADNLVVIVEDAACNGGSDDPNGRYDAANFDGISGDITGGDTVTMPDSSTVECTSGGDLNLRGSTVYLVWDGGASSTQTLRQWNAPG